ncbi:MAG: hypothetical protein EOP51_07450 [Sphingobacteriales bacterium]|nr:MAG: hypothetical protein EOP51_07450 [Sphingobacteriales bacterium]
MKNKILLACFAIIAIGATSCKKGDYTCRCTGPGAVVRNYEISGKTKKDAKNDCNSHNSGTPIGDVVCKLQ